MRKKTEEAEIAAWLKQLFADCDRLRDECEDYQKDLERVVGMLRERGVDPYKIRTHTHSIDTF